MDLVSSTGGVLQIFEDLLVSFDFTLLLRLSNFLDLKASKQVYHNRIFFLPRVFGWGLFFEALDNNGFD